MHDPITAKIHSSATLQLVSDGTLRLASFSPAVETLTFCWNSSTIESMSSSDSDSELSALTMHSMSDVVASLKIDDSAFSGLLAGWFIGDEASPSKSHSFSTSSFGPGLFSFEMDLDRPCVLIDVEALFSSHMLVRLDNDGLTDLLPESKRLYACDESSVNK